jgi:hypothetical protein
MRTKRSATLSVLALIVLLELNVQAQEKPRSSSPFRDSEDNAIDLSEWLLTRKGFLLIPTIITEPSVGFGGAGALVFYHSSYTEKHGPPSMTGVIGGGTVNGTWMAGVFHEGIWKNDTIRYRGTLVRTNLNLDYYGSGDVSLRGDTPVTLNLDAWIMLQQIKFRIPGSDFFAGARYLYLDTDNSFDIPIDTPDYKGQGFSSTLSEISAIVDLDTRDNVFTPTRGVFMELSGTYSDTWFGGEDQYGRLGATALAYMPLASRITVGVRYEGRYSLGPVPFWARPVVSLRGAPVTKYQNKNTTLMEAEVDWNLYKRWTLVGFTGLGNAFSSFTEFDQGKTVRTLGTGFRYLIARKLGTHMGMDFAFSGDDFAFYVVFGSAWLK